MKKVEGIGGFFFKATDPKMLATWYADHLGVVPRRSPTMVTFGPNKPDQQSLLH